MKSTGYGIFSRINAGLRVMFGQAAAPESSANDSFAQDSFALPRAIARLWATDSADHGLLNLMQYLPHFRLAAPLRPQNTQIEIDADGLPVSLRAGEVHTDKQNLSLNDAQKLAQFAAAHPRMRAAGLTVNGNRIDQLVLTIVAQSMGLPVNNPPEDMTPEEEKQIGEIWFTHIRELPENRDVAPLDDEMRKFLRDSLAESGHPEDDMTDDALDRRWIAMGAQGREQAQTMHAQQKAFAEMIANAQREAEQEDVQQEDAEHAEQTSAPQTLRETMNRAASPEVQAVLAQAGLDADLYTRAHTLVTESGKASLRALRTELHIGDRKARALMDALIADGVVERKTTSTLRRQTRSTHTVVLAPQ